MPIVKAQCTNCNGMLQVDSSKDAAICPYCNTPYIVEKAINKYNINNNYNIQHQQIINNNYGTSSAQYPEIEYNYKTGLEAAKQGRWNDAFNYLNLVPEWYMAQHPDTKNKLTYAKIYTCTNGFNVEYICNYESRFLSFGPMDYYKDTEEFIKRLNSRIEEAKRYRNIFSNIGENGWYNNVNVYVSRLEDKISDLEYEKAARWEKQRRNARIDTIVYSVINWGKIIAILIIILFFVVLPFCPR
ncbi:MAG: hypothetical protein J6M66_04730 [Lachnospiraceae bacterium]|nr:hypothetical protein [Lachnospiraceae bacterium]